MHDVCNHLLAEIPAWMDGAIGPMYAWTFARTLPRSLTWTRIRYPLRVCGGHFTLGEELLPAHCEQDGDVDVVVAGQDPPSIRLGGTPWST